MAARLPDRGTTLDRLIAALKPGGWLVLEEMEFPPLTLDLTWSADIIARFEKVNAMHCQVTGTHGFGLFYGRRLLGDLATSGLAGLGSEGRLSCWNGGSAGAEVWRLTFKQLGEEIPADDEMTTEDLTVVIALLEDPRASFLSQATIAAWRRRGDGNGSPVTQLGNPAKQRLAG